MGRRSRWRCKRALQNGMVIMGFTGGASLDGKKGNHCMLSPAYNVTDQEVENIVDVFVKSVEEVLWKRTGYEWEPKQVELETCAAQHHRV